MRRSDAGARAALIRKYQVSATPLFFQQRRERSQRSTLLEWYHCKTNKSWPVEEVQLSLLNLVRRERRWRNLWANWIQRRLLVSEISHNILMHDRLQLFSFVRCILKFALEICSWKHHILILVIIILSSLQYLFWRDSGLAEARPLLLSTLIISFCMRITTKKLPGAHWPWSVVDTCYDACVSIAEWSTQDVVEKYLKPINMEHMAKAFLENNINGAVLLALEV